MENVHNKVRCKILFGLNEFTHFNVYSNMFQRETTKLINSMNAFLQKCFSFGLNNLHVQSNIEKWESFEWIRNTVLMFGIRVKIWDKGGCRNRNVEEAKRRTWEGLGYRAGSQRVQGATGVRNPPEPLMSYDFSFLSVKLGSSSPFSRGRGCSVGTLPKNFMDVIFFMSPRPSIFSSRVECLIVVLIIFVWNMVRTSR